MEFLGYLYGRWGCDNRYFLNKLTGMVVIDRILGLGGSGKKKSLTQGIWLVDGVLKVGWEWIYEIREPCLYVGSGYLGVLFRRESQKYCLTFIS